MQVFNYWIVALSLIYDNLHCYELEWHWLYFKIFNPHLSAAVRCYNIILHNTDLYLHVFLFAIDVNRWRKILRRSRQPLNRLLRRWNLLQLSWTNNWWVIYCHYVMRIGLTFCKTQHFHLTFMFTNRNNTDKQLHMNIVPQCNRFFVSVKTSNDSDSDGNVVVMLLLLPPPPHKSTKSMRSSFSHLLSVLWHSLSFGSCRVHVCAPKIWNFLPAHILECQTLTSFRCRLKSHYFQSVYLAP